MKSVQWSKALKQVVKVTKIISSYFKRTQGQFRNLVRHAIWTSFVKIGIIAFKLLTIIAKTSFLDDWICSKCVFGILAGHYNFWSSILDVCFTISFKINQINLFDIQILN